MKVTVEKVEKSKSGKSYNVQAEGRWYTSKAAGIEQTAGKTIEATTGAFNMPDGTPRPTIESFTIVGGAPAPQSSYAPAQNGKDRWWLPFVSNQVAHAIAAGLIKQATDIRAFAITAKVAIIQADATSEDADLPF